MICARRIPVTSNCTHGSTGNPCTPSSRERSCSLLILRLRFALPIILRLGLTKVLVSHDDRIRLFKLRKAALARSIRIGGLQLVGAKRIRWRCLLQQLQNRPKTSSVFSTSMNFRCLCQFHSLPILHCTSLRGRSEVAVIRECMMQTLIYLL